MLEKRKRYYQRCAEHALKLHRDGASWAAITTDLQFRVGYEISVDQTKLIVQALQDKQSVFDVWKPDERAAEMAMIFEIGSGTLTEIAKRAGLSEEEAFQHLLDKRVSSE